jgi:hypothetical protein
VDDDAERVDGVARAIYMTHWREGDEARGIRAAPVWENASDPVKDHVRAQARAALAYLRRLIDEEPGL